MSTPTPITVTGTIRISGATVAGKLVFAYGELVRDSGSNDVMIPHEIEVEVESDGEFAAAVPSTDDPAFSPTFTCEIRPHFPGWTTPYRVSIPHDSPGGTVRFSDLVPIPASSSADLYALASHLHEDYPLMLIEEGEEVVPRPMVRDLIPLQTGTMQLTHFLARKSETIASIRTTIGSAVATGAEHAWIWVYQLVGGTWVKVAECSDDPTRWTSPNATYDSPLLAPWSKIRGETYAMAMLWIGSGDSPNLPGAANWALDAGLDPATSSYIGGQVSPANPLNPAFTAPTGSRLQAVMLPS